MRTLVCGKTFIRSLKRTIKKNPKYKKTIKDALKNLENNPFASKLETHKLKWELLGS